MQPNRSHAGALLCIYLCVYMYLRTHIYIVCNIFSTLQPATVSQCPVKSILLLGSTSEREKERKKKRVSAGVILSAMVY